MNIGRISRDEYFIRIADVVALRSTCNRAQVGAVLVDPYTNRIVATGYNGSAKGAPHCIDVGCLEMDLGTGHGTSCIRTIHAELNAVLHLEHNYTRLVLYSTHQPCFQCTKALIAANVKDIYYRLPYKDIARDLLLKEIELNMETITTRS